jgi:hypothetical protein
VGAQLNKFYFYDKNPECPDVPLEASKHGVLTGVSGKPF